MGGRDHGGGDDQHVSSINSFKAAGGGLAEHTRDDSRVAKVGCDRKTVRTCADDDGLAGAG